MNSNERALYENRGLFILLDKERQKDTILAMNNKHEEYQRSAMYVRDWGDLPVGAHFIEDTFNEVYEVLETGSYEAPVITDLKNPEMRFGVKAVVVGYQVGDKEPPKDQEPEVFNYDLDWGQPVYRIG